ncbi:hypothetical protein [Streptosporangium sp. KLBMP 9127]|nr:hypothetical protein [Streptosporangium sp. KLBMP 9127]
MTRTTPAPATFLDALRSEWSKFRTGRATVVNALVTVVLGTGIAALFGSAGAREYAAMPVAEQTAFDPGGTVFRSLLLSQLALAAMGALTATAEYRAGTMGVSVTAVPRRGRLLAAKAAVVALAGLVVGEITAFSVFLAGNAMLAGQGAPHLTLGDDGALGAVAGAGLYLALIGLLGLATGVLLRASAGAITALAAGIVLLPALATSYPEWLASLVLRYWPSVAGSQIFAFSPDPRFLPPGPGFALCCAFVAVLAAVALAVFRTRDV